MSLCLGRGEEAKATSPNPLYPKALIQSPDQFYHWKGFVTYVARTKRKEKKKKKIKGLDHRLKWLHIKVNESIYFRIRN